MSKNNKSNIVWIWIWILTFLFLMVVRYGKIEPFYDKKLDKPTTLYIYLGIAYSVMILLIWIRFVYSMKDSSSGLLLFYILMIPVYLIFYGSKTKENLDWK